MTRASTDHPWSTLALRYVALHYIADPTAEDWLRAGRPEFASLQRQAVLPSPPRLVLPLHPTSSWRGAQTGTGTTSIRTKLSLLVVWVVTPYGLVGRYRRFGGTRWVSPQGLRAARSGHSQIRSHPPPHIRTYLHRIQCINRSHNVCAVPTLMVSYFDTTTLWPFLFWLTDKAASSFETSHPNSFPSALIGRTSGDCRVYHHFDLTFPRV
jgi:hypothetical protein